MPRPTRPSRSSRGSPGTCALPWSSPTRRTASRATTRSRPRSAGISTGARRRCGWTCRASSAARSRRWSRGSRASGRRASIVVLVAERSDGIPLLVEELTAARRELSSASLTGSLAEIVAARLARRTPECRRVLRLLVPRGTADHAPEPRRCGCRVRGGGAAAAATLHDRAAARGRRPGRRSRRRCHRSARAGVHRPHRPGRHRVPPRARGPRGRRRPATAPAPALPRRAGRRVVRGAGHRRGALARRAPARRRPRVCARSGRSRRRPGCARGCAEPRWSSPSSWKAR